MAKWIIKKNSADIKKMSQALKISETMAQVLVNRNINSPKLFNKYINPEISKLGDFTVAKDVVKAFEIIKETIAQKGKIFVYGDYDVDGVTSVTILMKGLRELNANAQYYIPHRVTEGYGLNKDAVLHMKGQGCDLVITCDNGITSIAEIEYANELKMKSIIIDHHEPRFTEIEGIKEDELPNANAVINPKQKNCQYPYKYMSAGGICFRFISTLFAYMGLNLKSMDELLIFAGISTFCDIVDLTDENRILSKNALDKLNTQNIENIGLRALIEERGVKGNNINEFVIGFVIGPCINAGGRLSKASMAVELFLENDEERAKEIAKELSLLNEERKQMTQQAVEMAVEEIENSNMEDTKVYFIHNSEIHESIAGIVAGRIKDKYYHPVIVFTGEGEIVKGSARSIHSYNIYEGLFQHNHLFTRFGGHAMAAGLSLPADNLFELYNLMNSNCTLTDEEFEEVIHVDMEITLEDITYKTAKELEYLSPFGKENKEPIFLTKNIRVEEIRFIDNKDTIIITFITKDNRYIKALLFGKTEMFKTQLMNNFDTYDYDKIIKGLIRNVNLNMDVVYYISINEYNNNVSVQMNIKDFKLLN